MVPAAVSHRVVHPETTVDRPEWYRSRDGDDGDVLAAGAGDPVDRAPLADTVGHEQRTQAIQACITIRRVGRVQLTACADPFKRARILELLQQFEVVVAGNAEQVSDAGLFQSA